MAPALVALMPSRARRSSSSRRSSTPQVKAPCAPPPCSARLMDLVAFRPAGRGMRAGFAEVSRLSGRSRMLASIGVSLPRSMRRPAAVDRERGAGDRGRGVAAEEDGERTQFLHAGEAFGGLLGEKHVPDHLIARDAVTLCLVVDLLLDQRRPDVAGTDCIAGDAALR